MPPGRGFYGQQFRTRRQERRLAPFYLLAAVPFLALFAWVAMSLTGGDEPVPQAQPGEPGPALDGGVSPSPAFTPAPTRHPSSRAGGATEGTYRPQGAAPKPDIREYLIAGGNRFALPLTAHAGVEDYFGTDRGDGLRHAGVDFSLPGLKNIVVQSACNGEVVATGSDERYGTHVVIDCGGEFTTVYGWLQSLRVARGNLVSKSTAIGTGEPGGFLHFEIRYQGVSVDPADFVQIPGREVIPWTPTPT
ncbi:M23 family metallopeptidase, partial [Tepidiforma sp.]|uniref:murein hydrolase activator EnvC family protein n=1 Tax=Tepidiforma sp. TaxID=2682230 RepID=UPI002ADD51E8